MKKKVFFTLAFAALLTLGFVCQKQSSVKALIDNNIEALTDIDGESDVEIVVVPCYPPGTGWGFDHFPQSGYDTMCDTSNPVGTMNGHVPCTGETRSDFGAPMSYCWDIIVRP